MGCKHKLQHPSVLLMGRGGGAGGVGVCGRSKHPHPSPQLPVEGEAPQAQVHPIRAACNTTEREGGVELGLKSPASREASTEVQPGVLSPALDVWPSQHPQTPGSLDP